MQGVILNVRSAQGLILGNDGVRYTFTHDEWQNDDLAPELGMRVDFEARGSEATDIYPIPGASPVSAATPNAPPTQLSGAPPSTPPVSPPPEKRTGMRWWRWTLAVGTILVLGIASVYALAIFSTSNDATDYYNRGACILATWTASLRHRRL